MKRKLFMGLVFALVLALLSGSFAIAEDVATKKIKLTSTTVTAGFSTQLVVTGVDADTESFKAVDNKFGTVTADGLFTGKKAGSFNVTVYGTVEGKSKDTKIKLTVKANTKTINSKPTKPKNHIGVNVKKKYFKGDDFYIDFNIYNGYFTRKMAKFNLFPVFVADRDSGYVVASRALTDKKFSLGYKKSKTLTVKLNRDDLSMATKYDLRNGGADRLLVDFSDWVAYGSRYKGLDEKGMEIEEEVILKATAR